MSGRCWPVDGTGGTLNAAGTGPGPYYVLAADDSSSVGGGEDSAQVTTRAVFYGVLALQRALRRLQPIPLAIDGIFGQETAAATFRFQQKAKLGADGVIGPKTAKALFTPAVKRLATADVPSCLLLGQIQNESMFDPGAVGYVDDRDLGLLQINGHWHPDMTEPERFAPLFAIDYAVGIYEANLAHLDELSDAVAAYNLGLGGAKSWIEHGRPDVIDYYPTGPVHIRDYIDRILANCP